MATRKSAKHKKISPIVVIVSVMAASFGVQTQINRERDFEHGSFHHFIIGGNMFTFIFVLLLVFIVEIHNVFFWYMNGYWLYNTLNSGDIRNRISLLAEPLYIY